jgi:hypothetical protein
MKIQDKVKKKNNNKIGTVVMISNELILVSFNNRKEWCFIKDLTKQEDIEYRCDHSDCDEHCCLICGKDMTEEFIVRAYDKIKNIGD